MTRVVRAWGAIDAEQRLAAGASLALLVTMFFPWYGLQSLNRRTGAIYSHNINAFGDVSFVEAAIFLVSAGVLAMLFARAERRDFRLPGGDGTIVTIAGGWAALLIFYRVFDRPSGNGYPVGIQWGFFLAFVAAGSLAYAGWRMRAHERPDPPARRSREARGGDGGGGRGRHDERAQREREGLGFVGEPERAVRTAARGDFTEEVRARRGREQDAQTARRRAADAQTVRSRESDAQRARSREDDARSAPRRAGRAAPVPARERAPYPPAPGELEGAPRQLSFEDPPARER